MPYDARGNYITTTGTVIAPMGAKPPSKTVVKGKPPVQKSPVVKSPVPPNPVSKAIKQTSMPSVQNPKPLAGLSVSEQQKRLKSAGFNVTVDGVEGPQTAMARKAFINGVSPDYWNKVWLKNHPPAGSPSGKAPPVSSGSSGTKPSTTPTSSTPSVTTPSGTGTTPATKLTLIDPNQYATDAANAEFAPQLAGANFDLRYAQKQLPEQLKDLAGWNQQVTNTFNHYDAAGAMQPGIDQANAAAGNVAQLFGGSTGAQAQAANDPNQAMLQGLQGSQKGFQDIMQSVLAAQGRDYGRRAMRENSVDVAKAQSDLAGIQAQKGAARSKYLGDATTTRTNQEQAQAALDQASALAGPELATAKAKATVAQTEAANAPKIAAIGLQKARVEMKATIAQIKANADKTNGVIHWNSPAVIDSVSNGAVTGSIGPKGGLVLRPDLALQNVLVAAQGAGAPPAVVTAAISKLVRAMNVSHGKKQWSRWSWNGKQFVLGPKPKKK